LIVAAHQKTTLEWWSHHRQKYDLTTSALVVQEISRGEERNAVDRQAILKGIRLLAIIPEAIALAKVLIQKGPLPKKAEEDALHIATATVHRVDYLLSWNCKHIANVFMQKDLTRIIQGQGWECPIICTPESMLELTK
jgi:predicted nucleic acid-binding protein